MRIAVIIVVAIVCLFGQLPHPAPSCFAGRTGPCHRWLELAHNDRPWIRALADAAVKQVSR